MNTNDYIDDMVSKRQKKELSKINMFKNIIIEDVKDVVMEDVNDKLYKYNEETKQYIQNEVDQYKKISTQIEEIVQKIKTLDDKKDIAALQEYIKSVNLSLKLLSTKDELNETKKTLSSNINNKAEKEHTHVEFKNIDTLKNKLEILQKNIQDLPDFWEVKKAFNDVYTKDETYSKKEVDTKISKIKSWDIVMLSKWWWEATRDGITDKPIETLLYWNATYTYTGWLVTLITYPQGTIALSYSSWLVTTATYTIWSDIYVITYTYTSWQITSITYT